MYTLTKLFTISLCPCIVFYLPIHNESRNEWKPGFSSEQMEIGDRVLQACIHVCVRGLHIGLIKVVIRKVNLYSLEKKIESMNNLCISFSFFLSQN